MAAQCPYSSVESQERKLGVTQRLMMSKLWGQKLVRDLTGQTQFDFDCL